MYQVEPFRVRLLAAAGDLDEVNRGDAVRAHELMHLPLEVFIPLPAARLAGEVVRRQTDEQNLGVPQSAEDAMPPIVHVFDFFGVEEDRQRLGGKPAAIGEDVIVQGRHPAMRVGSRNRQIVLAGIADEDFIPRRGVAHGQAPEFFPGCCGTVGDRVDLAFRAFEWVSLR